MKSQVFISILILSFISLSFADSDTTKVLEETCKRLKKTLADGTLASKQNEEQECRVKNFSKKELAKIDECEAKLPLKTKEDIEASCKNPTGNADKMKEALDCMKKALENEAGIEKLKGCCPMKKTM